MEDFRVLVYLVVQMLLRSVGHFDVWVGARRYRARDLIKFVGCSYTNGWASLGIRRLLGRFPQALCPAAATTRKAGLDASRAVREPLRSTLIVAPAAGEMKRLASFIAATDSSCKQPVLRRQ